MAAPWAEGPYKVVVEFLKSGSGAKRTIQLKHSAAVVPPQLQGRITPQAWQAFMTDIEQVWGRAAAAVLLPCTPDACSRNPAGLQRASSNLAPLCERCLTTPNSGMLPVH